MYPFFYSCKILLLILSVMRTPFTFSECSGKGTPEGKLPPGVIF